MTKPLQNKPEPVEVPREEWKDLSYGEVLLKNNIKFDVHLPMSGEKRDFDTLGKSVVALGIERLDLRERIVPIVWWNTVGDEGSFCEDALEAGEKWMLEEIQALYDAVRFSRNTTMSMAELEEERDWFLAHGWNASVKVTVRGTRQKKDEEGEQDEEADDAGSGETGAGDDEPAGG